MLALRRCNLIKTSRLLTRLSSSSSSSVKAKSPPSPPSQSQSQPHPRTDSRPQDIMPTTTTTTTPSTPTSSDASSSRGSDAMALPSPGQPLLEAAPPPGQQRQEDDGPPQTLRVGGDAVRLDAMGPLVVNVDGSLGRVANWAEMTPGEREGTTRLLKRRNQERLRVLKERGIEGGK